MPGQDNVGRRVLIARCDHVKVGFVVQQQGQTFADEASTIMHCDTEVGHAQVQPVVLESGLIALSAYAAACIVKSSA